MSRAPRFSIASRVLDGKTRSGNEIVCGACGEKLFVVNTSRSWTLPDEAVAQRARAAGWVLGSRVRHDRCPRCESNAKKEKTMSETKDKPAPTPAASKRITALYMMLEDHYDREAKCYRNGQSDERIAKELSLSVELVVKRREQDFGPLVAPPCAVTPEVKAALAAMRWRVTEAEKALDTLNAELATVRAHLNDLAQLMGVTS